MAHKGARDDLTAEYVREILAYDPETGVLTWKVSRPPRGKIGAKAGYPTKNGRWAIGIHGEQYYSHRLAWLIMTGEWPPFEIDHKDHDPSNNRWGNMRLATSSQNVAHQHLNRRNTSGYTGVSFVKNYGRYWAYIDFQKTRHHIGYFDSAEDAYAAYSAKAKELHGEFAHVNAKARP
jgi:hypothetical protein